jgi:hypothetical protein
MHIQKTNHVTVTCLLQTVDKHRCLLQQDLVNVVFSCYISSSYTVTAVYPIFKVLNDRNKGGKKRKLQALSTLYTSRNCVHMS